jgi:hypothetical protein
VTPFAALLLALTLPNARAVCPRERVTARDEYRGSDVVVVGTVVRATPVPLSRDFQEGTAYVVRVTEKLKGKSPAQLRLFSENGGARFPMRVGTKYLLFIDHLERSVIDNCGNSGTVAARRQALATVRRLRHSGAG